MSQQQSHIKKTESTNSNINTIIQKHAHILDNCQIMQNKEIIVA